MFMRVIKYTKHSNIIQSIQQDKAFIKVAMQTVVYNAQLIYRAEMLYFRHMYPSLVVQTVRQYYVWIAM